MSKAGAVPSSEAPASARLVETVALQRREAVGLAIENAAMELFAVRRMADVTVEEIAVHAGVAVRTLYRYFPTKEHLFAGLPRRGAERLAERLHARPASESPFEALRNAMVELRDGYDDAALERWMRAVRNSGDFDRIVRMAQVVSTSTLVDAMSARAGLETSDLWPEMAGTMAAAAMIVGAGQWAHQGGDVIDHLLAALDVAGAGLSSFDPAAAAL